MSPPATGPDEERVREFCRAARDYVLRATGCAIEINEESLAFVDHYLGVVRGHERLGEELLRLVSAALGVHLGEVAIGKFGGRWIVPSAAGREAGDAAPDPRSWRVELSCVPLIFDPVGMAAEALCMGEVEGYDASLATRAEWTDLLSATLSRVPVSAEYYYSLTGRLETISYAVEILSELMQRAREQGHNGAPPEHVELDEDLSKN